MTSCPRDVGILWEWPSSSDNGAIVELPGDRIVNRPKPLDRDVSIVATKPPPVVHNDRSSELEYVRVQLGLELS